MMDMNDMTGWMTAWMILWGLVGLAFLVLAGFAIAWFIRQGGTGRPLPGANQGSNEI